MNQMPPGAMRALHAIHVQQNPFNGPFEFKRLAASVARDFDMPVEWVLSHDRSRETVNARAVIIQICVERGMSTPAIGRRLGGRDHATIQHAKKSFSIYLKHRAGVRESYERHVALREEAAEARAQAEAARQAVIDAAMAEAEALSC